MTGDYQLTKDWGPADVVLWKKMDGGGAADGGLPSKLQHSLCGR